MTFDMLSIRDVDLFVRREPADGWLPVQEEDEQHEPSARPPCRDFSLVFVIRDETERTVLLGKKKRGLGKGMFNGFGGKREPGETMQECAIRELQEECGLRVAREHMQPRGTLTIVRPAAEESGATIVANIHLFTARQWQGAPVETEEMTPAWFNIEGMPYDEMWPEASIYVPALLSEDHLGPPLSSHLLYGRVDYSAPMTIAGLWLGWSSKTLDAIT